VDTLDFVMVDFSSHSTCSPVFLRTDFDCDARDQFNSFAHDDRLPIVIDCRKGIVKHSLISTKSTKAEQRKTQVLPKIIYYSNRFCRTFAYRFLDGFRKCPHTEEPEGHFGEKL
jgi:hypothetical protein